MHLDAGNVYPCQTVGKRKAGMGIGSGIEGNAVRMTRPALSGLFQTVNKLAFMVGLKIIQLNGFLSRPGRAEHIPDQRKGGIHAFPSVYFRLTSAENAEIWTIENQNFHRVHPSGNGKASSGGLCRVAFCPGQG